MLLRIFTEPQQGADYGTLLSVARAAEELGFDAFFRSDHYLSMGGSGLPGPTDAWVNLAGLARDTARVRLGTLVSPVTFRLPGQLAIMVAQVDQMSGGRVELGLGAGWFEAEHQAQGIPFPPQAERFGRLEEQLEIITGLWGTAEGAYGRVRHACREAGRDPGSLAYSAAQTVCCGRDGAEVARRAEAIGEPLEELRQTGLAGSPAQIADKLGRLAAAGATRAYLQVLDLNDLDHLELLASEVLPQVR